MPGLAHNLFTLVAAVDNCSPPLLIRSLALGFLTIQRLLHGREHQNLAALIRRNRPATYMGVSLRSKTIAFKVRSFWIGASYWHPHISCSERFTKSEYALTGPGKLKSCAIFPHHQRSIFNSVMGLLQIGIDRCLLLIPRCTYLRPLCAGRFNK